LRVNLALFAGLYVFFGSGGILLLRASLSGGSGGLVHAALHDYRVALGGIFYVIGFTLWLAALRRYEVTLAYPIFAGAAYIGVMVGGAVILGESFTTVKVVGALLIGAGLIVISV
jgi:multidrug transporter EmrE-like cation transporter